MGFGFTPGCCDCEGGGGGTGAFPGCSCTTAPSPLYMTVTGDCDSSGLFYDCTFVYGDTPTELEPLGLGDNCWLSAESFPDTQTGDMFRYYLSCFSTLYRVSRVYAESIYGSPFLGSVVYHWSTGLPGNTCTPFALTNGEIFLGGVAECVVEINETP